MTDAAILDVAIAEAEILDDDAIAEAKDAMKAKYSTMVEYFLEDAETYIAAIQEGIAAGVAGTIVSPAHTLKSSGKQMGAKRVSEIAEAMELLAREQSNAGKNDMPPFAEMLGKLETAFSQTREAFELVT